MAKVLIVKTGDVVEDDIGRLYLVVNTRTNHQFVSPHCKNKPISKVICEDGLIEELFFLKEYDKVIIRNKNNETST